MTTEANPKPDAATTARPRRVLLIATDPTPLLPAAPQFRTSPPAAPGPASEPPMAAGWELSAPSDPRLDRPAPGEETRTPRRQHGSSARPEEQAPAGPESRTAARGGDVPVVRPGPTSGPLPQAPSGVGASSPPPPAADGSAPTGSPALLVERSSADRNPRPAPGVAAYAPPAGAASPPHAADGSAATAGSAATGSPAPPVERSLADRDPRPAPGVAAYVPPVGAASSLPHAANGSTPTPGAAATNGVSAPAGSAARVGERGPAGRGAPQVVAALRDPAATVSMGAVQDAGTGPRPVDGERRKGRGGRHAGVAPRPVPTVDPRLVERPGAVLPGWAGVLAGAVALVACAMVAWWSGAVPETVIRLLALPFRPYHGLAVGPGLLLALGALLAVLAFGGLVRGRVGYAWVLTLFGDYRGSVRHTGLMWVSPLLVRRRVDVRLRHWRSEPLPAVDANGTPLRVVVLVVWRIQDTVRAVLSVADHETYLREQVEAAMARVLSQLPADTFHLRGDTASPTLRNGEAVGEALTRTLAADCAPVGVEVFSAQPTRIEYAPEIAAAMRRRRIAAIDAEHRDAVLTSVVDAVDDVVHRLTSRGLVELDDYDRKSLVKDLTVAFYTGHAGPVEGA